MSTLEGTITIAQESRFQLVDGRGVGHLLILDALALAEPDQLADLSRRQVRVSVQTKPGHGIIGNVATSILVL